MDFSKLSAGDQRIAIAGAIVAVTALISFVDPSGSWGAVMIVALLGGLGAVFIVVQPQMAPAAKLPATKAMSLLVVGGLATAAYVLAALSYLGYFFRNLADVFEIIFIVGLVAAAFLTWTGWRAYSAERGTSPAAPPPPPPPPAAPPAEPPAAPPAS